MRRQKFSKFTVISAALISCSLMACHPAAPKDLFEDTCSRCHPSSVPKSRRMNRTDWRDIVIRMRANGCDITDKEAAIIVDYLAKEYGR